MHHYSLGLAAMTVLELDPVEHIRCAAETGYSFVGLRPIPGVMTESLYWNRDTPARVEKALKDYDMKVLDIEVFRLKPDTRPINFLPVLEIGARLGAREVQVVADDPDRERLAGNFAELADISAEFGMGVNIEPMLMSQLHTVCDAAELLRKVNRKNAGVLIDAIHFDRAGSSVDDIALLPEGSIHYLHLCDAPAVRPRDIDEVRREARGCRLSPGRGSVDIATLLKAVPRDIPLSIECVNREYTLRMSPLEKARMLREDLEKILSAL